MVSWSLRQILTFFLDIFTILGSRTATKIWKSSFYANRFVSYNVKLSPLL
jgi:hypothetical protein